MNKKDTNLKALRLPKDFWSADNTSEMPDFYYASLKKIFMSKTPEEAYLKLHGKPVVTCKDNIFKVAWILK